MKCSPSQLAPAFAVLVLCLGIAQEAPAQLRDVRYCEVLGVYLRDGALEADVWNTTGLNLCPEAEWEALDSVAIQQQLGSLLVLLNGPRFWTLDAIVAPPSDEVMDFGGIDMRRAATVAVPSFAPPAPYTSNSVDRDTEFVFLAGSEVYELVDPDGLVYVMQSYSHLVDDTLSEADLPGLGSRLQLPPGWRFRTRIVAADYVVEDQAGVATVVQDELRNSYQLVIPIPVEIDIRPGTPFNPIRPGSRGVVPVALLGSESFDVAAVDAATLAFGPDAAGPVRWIGSHVWDVDRDGFDDLVAFHRVARTGIRHGDDSACLTGETLDGIPFQGCDRVWTVPRRWSRLIFYLLGLH